MKSVLIVIAAVAITLTSHAQLGGLGKKIPGVGGGDSSGGGNADLGKLESESFEKVTPAAEKTYEASVLFCKALNLQMEEVKEQVGTDSKKGITLARIGAAKKNFDLIKKSKKNAVNMSPEQKELFSQGHNKLGEAFGLMTAAAVPVGFAISDAMQQVQANPALALQYKDLAILGAFCLKDIKDIAEVRYMVWEIGRKNQVPGIPESGPEKKFTPKKG